jgi:cyclic beta-1,2-glucan synthetase
MELMSRRTSSPSSPAAGGVEQLAQRTYQIECGDARTMLTTAGSGSYSAGALAVTRWTDDPTCDADGVYLYVRDLEDGRYWSAGFQPTAVEPESYDAQFSGGVATFRRRDAGIALQLEVALCAETGADLRRCTLTNLSDRPRSIELTSYLEWVLQDAAADAAHPAFCKLFVETEIVAAQRLILARRRSRDPRDAALVGAHWVVDAASDSRGAAALQFETSRSAFVRRGRDLRNPAAMTAPVTRASASGPVLDAIASLRRAFYLAPNESASITFGLAAHRDESALRDVIGVLTPALAESAFVPRAEPASHAKGALAAGLRVDPPHERSRSNARDFEPLQESAIALVPGETLLFDNGYGGFAADGREYVIRLRPGAGGPLQLPPMPWSHVVANPHAGFIATETGAGFTWTVNSRENRLTHWRNDPISDPHSEAIYLRDRDRRSFWSPLPGPAGLQTMHEVRYGFGSAQYEHASADLRQRVRQFVPLEDAVKIIDVRLENESESARELDLFFYAHLALGNGDKKQREVRTWYDAESGAVFAANASRELSGRVAFVTVVGADGVGVQSYTGDRTEFLGAYGDLGAPAAIRSDGELSGRVGEGLDACAVVQSTVRIEPSDVGRCWVLIGEAEDEQAARTLIKRYATASAIDRALDEVRRQWLDLLSAVSVDTPSPALNLMVNGWLPYQNISCRLWGRSAYYQSGGAFGFRDQLQDSAALVYHAPAMTREQIVRHASAQFVEGDVLHWWHPPATRGIRTRFADDLLWLPLVAAEYVATTGDHALWDESAPFLRGLPLEPGEAERFQTPSPAGESASIYEHACRAIDRSLAAGVHGLPLMGCGDWNDGMNRVGAGGAGESVWMAFFLDVVLQRMLPICAARGDHARVQAYRDRQRRLRHALDVHGWDGQWFRRAYFDDGSPLGTREDAECQIDALVQAWAVLSGAADRDRTLEGISAVERRLVRDEAGLIQLLDPPFDRTSHNPGYIKGYVPGVRENGGQYTHGVLWYVRALAELGRGNRAVELLDMLNPIHHARTAQEVSVYQVEPYVVAADVYSQPPHVGRGGWTWYTGSAGWMFRVAVESILGLRIRDGQALVLNPCISAAWPSCRLAYRLPHGGGAYEITIENPLRRETGVREASVDDRPATIENGAAVVPLALDGETHHVRLRL